MVGLKERLKPSELEIGALWLTGAPADVEAPVLLIVEDTSVMTGEGIPVAVRLTDVIEEFANEDDVLSGPVEPVIDRKSVV